MTSERRTNNQQQPNLTVTASFSATIYQTNTLYTLPPPPSLWYIHPPPPFPTAVLPFPPHPLSGIHPTLTSSTILLTSSKSTCQSLSNYPQPTRKLATSSPLSYHTLNTFHHYPLSSILILQQSS